MKTIRQIYEALRMATQSVVINKVRTLLSLLGITIGIFSIISIFTVLDAVEQKIRDNVDKIGSNVMYVGKWPWTPEEGQTEYEWWKFVNRPSVSTKEFQEASELIKTAESTALAVSIYNITIKSGNRSRKEVELIAATYDYPEMRPTEIRDGGRYFTPMESNSGAQVAIIGTKLAEDLFDDVDYAIGKTIKTNNISVTVIGVFETEGTNMFGTSYDEQVLIPYTLARSFVNLSWYDKDFIIKGKEGVATADLIDDIRSVMRRLRRLPPSAEDNFAVNESSGILKQVESIFSMINLVWGFIGGLSILVGGFGIANIMFVSVRERTALIGIQKALGAKSYTILLQFTFEAVLLSIAGGAIGLFLIWIGTLVATYGFDFEIGLTLKNIVIGLGISSAIGAVAGIFPAYSAAKMDPVRAMSK